jgi:hypothetical protein
MRGSILCGSEHGCEAAQWRADASIDASQVSLAMGVQHESFLCDEIIWP